ncbi:MAG: nucleotidyl transferase AbiEii/AbiGii toxin family protein [Bacteroidia bacterium]
MKILEPLFKKVIMQLLDSNVEFLLIGGYAVNYYGYGRYTGDIDFWIKPDNENKLLLLNAFVELGRNKEDIYKMSKLDFNKPQIIFMGEPPLRVDFLTRVNLLDFDEAWSKRKLWDLDAYKVPIVDYEDLILTKMTTGRPKDKLDVEELQKINQKKK